jgi:hypothetical protein
LIKMIKNKNKDYFSHVLFAIAMVASIALIVIHFIFLINGH